jgi:hypothetical protein
MKAGGFLILVLAAFVTLVAHTASADNITFTDETVQRGLEGRSNATFLLSSVPEPAETVGLLSMWVVVAASFGLKRYRQFRQHRTRVAMRQATTLARASAAE